MITTFNIVRDAAHSVFDELGTGHSEAVYESAMVVELGLQGMGPVSRQVPCPIIYKGFTVGIGYIDIVVDNLIAIELKAVAKFSNRDEMQLRKYLLGSGLDYGVLINFTQATSGTTWEGLEIAEISLNNQKEIIHDQTPSTEN